MGFRFEVKLDKEGKILLGSAAKIPFSGGQYGTIFFTPINKAKKNQILSLDSNFSIISGWQNLTKEQQEEVTTTLTCISKSVTPVKRSRTSSASKKKKQSPSINKSPAKKAKTDKTVAKKKKKKKDPNAPKRALTPFFIFAGRMRKKYAEENPEA